MGLKNGIKFKILQELKDPYPFGNCVMLFMEKFPLRETKRKRTNAITRSEL